MGIENNKADAAVTCLVLLGHATLPSIAMRIGAPGR